MDIELIYAVRRDGVVGRDNAMPWHLPGDLKRFRAITTGHAVVMGRKTYESLNGRGLPKRNNYVLTSRVGPDGAEETAGNGVTVRLYRDCGQILDHARAAGTRRCFIIGGPRLWDDTLDVATVVHQTLVMEMDEARADDVRWRVTLPDAFRLTGATYDLDSNVSYLTWVRMGPDQPWR